MKFLCDQMLGTLAKWLRIYGLDTFFANSETDDKELLKIAKAENRTLVTRDRELTYSAKRENLTVIELKTKDLDEQIKAVLNYVKIDKSKILSRCIICNSVVDEIKKDDVKNKVPEKVFEINEDFWYCKKCDKIYWKGTHYEKMIEKTMELK